MNWIKKHKSTTPPQAAGYEIGVQPIHSPQAAGNTTRRDLISSGEFLEACFDKIDEFRQRDTSQLDAG
jgi:hypothetical protein